LSRLGRLIRSDYGRWSAVFLLFSVAAVVQTWPLVIHAADSIVIWENFPWDSWQFLWNLWWVKQALVEIHTNPFHTDLLYFPQGTDLYLHTLAVVIGVLSIPLQLATDNLILSWNVLALAFFVLSGLGMYALSYRITGNHWAALLSGYIFAFAPFTLMHFAGHWNISTTWPIPLFVLFLLRLHDSGRLREALAAGACWAILTYNNLEYGAWAGLFLAYWSFVYLRQGQRGRLVALWRGVAVAAGAWLAMTAPLLIPASLAVHSGDYTLPGGDEYYSADLASFVTPSPLWGPGTAATSPAPNHVSTGGIENTVYLGIIPLLLASLALFSVRRTPHRVLFWTAVFLFFAILALGPYLYIGDTKTFSFFGASFSVPLPYQIYDELPLVSVGRVPSRMIVFGLVGLAVLAGTGLEVLMSWLREKYKKVVPLAALVVLSIVVLEYWNPPVYLYEPPTPAILEAIGDEQGDFAVLNVPWGRGNGGTWSGDFAGSWLADYHQSIHGKATIGGFISRSKQRDVDWVWERPGLRFLACAHCTEFFTEDDMNPDLVRQIFRQYRIKYVVQKPGGYLGFEEHSSYLTDVLGLRPIFTDPTLIVYRNQEIE
jgi:hypothetical protein